MVLILRLVQVGPSCGSLSPTSWICCSIFSRTMSLALMIGVIFIDSSMSWRWIDSWPKLDAPPVT